MLLVHALNEPKQNTQSFIQVYNIYAIWHIEYFGQHLQADIHHESLNESMIFFSNSMYKLCILKEAGQTLHKRWWLLFGPEIEKTTNVQIFKKLFKELFQTQGQMYDVNIGNFKKITNNMI